MFSCITSWFSLSLNQREKSIHLLANKANIPGCYSPPHAQLNTLENLPAFSVSHDNMIKPESHDSSATNKHHHTRWTSFRQVSGVFYWRITAFWRQFLFYYRRRHLSLGHFDLVPSLNTQMYEWECDRSAMRICKLPCVPNTLLSPHSFKIETLKSSCLVYFFCLTLEHTSRKILYLKTHMQQEMLIVG